MKSVLEEVAERVFTEDRDHLIEFVLCCEDESQGSSEIQFKLALLLSGTANLCVVDDWKQSIHSFQHAAIENITEFEHRLERSAGELNDDTERVSFPLETATTIELRRNYRSIQSILDFSENALVTSGSSPESVDRESILGVVSLSSNTVHDTHHRADRV